MSTQVLDRAATGDIAPDGLRGILAARRRFRFNRRLALALIGLIAAGGSRLVRLGLVAGRAVYRNHRRRLCRRQCHYPVAACRRLRRQDPGRRQSVRACRPIADPARRPRLSGRSGPCRGRGPAPDGGAGQSAREIRAAAIDDRSGRGRSSGQTSGSRFRPRGRRALSRPGGVYIWFVADLPEGICRRPQGRGDGSLRRGRSRRGPPAARRARYRNRRNRGEFRPRRRPICAAPSSISATPGFARRSTGTSPTEARK